MAIDNCSHTFEKLATEVLPRYMAELRHRMGDPTPMSEFATKGVGVVALLRRFNRTADFQGCYVLMEGDYPIYTGISRKVFARLRQHVRGRTHF